MDNEAADTVSRLGELGVTSGSGRLSGAAAGGGEVVGPPGAPAVRDDVVTLLGQMRALKKQVRALKDLCNPVNDRQLKLIQGADVMSLRVDLAVTNVRKLRGMVEVINRALGVQGTKMSGPEAAMATWLNSYPEARACRDWLRTNSLMRFFPDLIVQGNKGPEYCRALRDRLGGDIGEFSLGATGESEGGGGGDEGATGQ